MRRIVSGRQLKYTAAVLLLPLLSFLLVDRLLPLPDPGRVNSVIVLAEDGSPLRAFADQNGVWRYPVDPVEISPLYIEALLGYEDRWFYYHPGVNPLAMLRAFGQWLWHGDIVSGGSTLTMQVARIIEPHSRSVGGKFWQIFRALQLEWHYSKADILGFYLNLAPFGGPIEGVQTASHAYLRKPARFLTHAEAALLAVLPQAPSRLRPDRHPAKAQRYRNKVLVRMVALGIWDEATVRDALLEPVHQSGFSQPRIAPLFTRRMKDDPRYAGQARINTAINADLQWAVENILRSRLGVLPDKASAAILVMENATGLVRAYAGSADFLDDARAGHVDMVQAIRSPGSTLKPFLYGIALDKGLMHSASLLSDVPLKVGGYAPKNFLQDFRGPVSFRDSLQLSLNVPAVELLQRIGPAEFDARLSHGGLQLQYPAGERANLSLILGGGGTNLESLVRTFSGFSRQGITIRPRLSDAEPVVERRLLSAGAGWIINDILRGIEAPSGFSAKTLGVAWKTGTSFGFRDAWSVGTNQRYTVGVWTGRPDGTPLPGQFGARAAGPLLFEVFQLLPAARTANPPPATVTKAQICWPLGRLKTETPPAYCQQQVEAWILDGLVPPTAPSLRDTSWSAGVRQYWVNPQSKLQVVADCTGSRVLQEVAVWPQELKPWLTAEQLRLMQLPDFDPQCPPGVRLQQARALLIRGLDRSSKLKLPAAEGTQAADISLALQAVGGVGAYSWLVNGMPVGVDSEGRGLPYHFAEPGSYELTVLDEAANVDKLTIQVVR